MNSLGTVVEVVVLLPGMQNILLEHVSAKTNLGIKVIHHSRYDDVASDLAANQLIGGRAYKSRSHRFSGAIGTPRPHESLNHAL